MPQRPRPRHPRRAIAGRVATAAVLTWVLTCLCTVAFLSRPPPPRHPGRPMAGRAATAAVLTCVLTCLCPVASLSRPPAARAAPTEPDAPTTPSARPGQPAAALPPQPGKNTGPVVAGYERLK